jgi:hypothetical protein
MMQKLPKRAGSRAKFIFWQCVAFMFAFVGTTMLIGGNGVGLLLILGGFGMSVREAGLRRKWKMQQRGSS